MRQPAFIIMTSFAMAASAHAQTASSGNAPTPDAAGQQIAANGTPNGAAACASCHGQQGEGNAAAGFPRLAGQGRVYLERQLKNYASGNRNNPVMMPIAKALNEQQMAAVSAYYATLSAPSAKPQTQTQAPAQAQKRGQMLASVGDDKAGVQACANCHGPGGSGEPPNYPYLAGQHAPYLSASLGTWKDGSRKTDPSQQMNMIAKRLSDADIAAVSAWFASQPPPAPAVLRVNVPAGSAARPAAPSGTPGTSGNSGAGTAAGSSVPATGAGVEQGSPTTGGSQGPGGGGSASGSGSQGSPTGEAK